MLNDELILDDEVNGFLQGTLTLHGRVGDTKLIVLFSSEILDHWPPEIQMSRLDEMRPFLFAATQRKLAARQFSEVSGLLELGEKTHIVVLGWGDIAS
jgi:hypothetical protein